MLADEFCYYIQFYYSVVPFIFLTSLLYSVCLPRCYCAYFKSSPSSLFWDSLTAGFLLFQLLHIWCFKEKTVSCKAVRRMDL